jgi:hypothetical protein
MRRLLLAGVLCFAAIDAEAAQPIAFEAIYEASVQDWKLPGDIEAVTGTQIVRLEKTCTDWRMLAKFQLRATSREGRDLDFETDLSAIEALDGTRYRFNSETKMRGQSLMALEGQASRAAVGQAGRVQLTKPEAKTIPLPHDALFPVAAFVWTSRQWDRGQKTANYVLFDGTIPEPVRVFELLTGDAGKIEPAPEGDAKLLAGKGWRTSGSFHRYEGQESEPLTTLTQSVLANGIATELALDIGIADVALKLRRVRALSEPKC